MTEQMEYGDTVSDMNGAAGVSPAAPGTTTPADTIPDTTPEAVTPEAAIPEAAIPEAAIPEAAIPEAVIQEAITPEAATEKTPSADTAAEEDPAAPESPTPAAEDPAAPAAAAPSNDPPDAAPEPAAAENAAPTDETPASGGTENSEPAELLLPKVALEDLPRALQDGCARCGWNSLMPVQSLALPYMLAGKDVMVQSRTGSGKTGAYLLPFLTRLDPALAAVQALILVPTRELAVQVEREARTLLGDSGLAVAAIYGGVGYGKQMEALRQGVAVLVGTPGRVLDHLMRRTLHLDRLASLVFDEADRMLSIGFYPDMKEIQRYLPDHVIHTTLFSATYPPYVLRLAGEFLDRPQMLSLSTKQVHVAEVQHVFYECQRMDKDRALLRIIEVENPESGIIFCNTKSDVHYVTAVLQGFGFNADEISADLTQNRRETVLDRLRRGEIRFLVATDVAARGIDIPELSHVFLYTPPEDRESYIHRAGRTGRAGAAGTVISLVDIMEKMELKRIASFYKIPLIEHPVPTDEDAARAAGLRVTALLESRFRQLTGLEAERLQRFTALAETLGTAEDQRGLLALLLDDFYQKNLNPERFVPAGTSRRRSDDGRSGKKRKKERGGQSAGQSDRLADRHGQPEGMDDDAGQSERLPDEQRRNRRNRRRGRTAPDEAEGMAAAGGAPTENAEGESTDIPTGNVNSGEGTSRSRRRRRHRRRGSGNGDADQGQNAGESGESAYGGEKTENTSSSANSGTSEPAEQSGQSEPAGEVRTTGQS